jgi:hypothetical protein
MQHRTKAQISQHTCNGQHLVAGQHLLNRQGQQPGTAVECINAAADIATGCGATATQLSCNKDHEAHQPQTSVVEGTSSKNVDERSNTIDNEALSWCVSAGAAEQRLSFGKRIGNCLILIGHCVISTTSAQPACSNS